MIVLTLIALKIAVVFFIFKKFSLAKGCLNKIFLFFMVFFYVIINIFTSLPEKKFVHQPSRQKACFSNIRVLIGAVDMYNMDHKIMMTKLDLNALIQEKYLKGTFSGPEKECEYLTEGDLTNNGYIYCKIHGDIEGLKEKEIHAKKEEEQKRNSSFIKNVFSKIWAYEEKLDSYLSTALRPLLDTAPGGILYIILALFGLTGESFGWGGIINSLTFLFILTHLKKEDEDGVVYEEVYSSEENTEPLTKINNNNSQS